jgi:hypothetical protein
MSKVDVHFHKIQEAVKDALANDVRVHIGGSPAVIQVTRGTESKSFTTMYVDGDYKTGLLVPVELNPQGMKPLNNSQHQFTGNTCSKCFMAMMIRTGSCETCVNCGDTSSCG